MKNTLFSEVKRFSSCDNHLIFQLLRFSETNGRLVKNSDLVHCDNVILFPVVSQDGSVSSKKFILKALINHLGVGTLVNGHYTAIVKDRS